METMFSFKEIREHCVKIGMTECRIHLFDFDEKDASEDPLGQVFTAEKLIDFLVTDNLYKRGVETVGHLLVFFNANGFAGEVLTA